MQSVAVRVAVVMGGASGLGMARTFADNGMRVVIADVREEALVQAVAGLRGRGHEVVGVPTDVSQRADVEALPRPPSTPSAAPSTCRATTPASGSSPPSTGRRSPSGSGSSAWTCGDLRPAAVDTGVSANSMLTRPTPQGQARERSPQGAKLTDKMGAALAQEMHPDDVGRLVLDAILTETFWVFTDPRLLRHVHEQVDLMTNERRLRRLRLV